MKKERDPTKEILLPQMLSGLQPVWARVLGSWDMT